MYQRCNSRNCKKCHAPCPSCKFDDIYKYLLTKDCKTGLRSPLVYSFFKKRRKSSCKPETDDEDDENLIPQPNVEEVVVPPENVKLLKNGEEQKENDDLCSTCHPPIVKVIFIKKQKGGRKKCDEEKEVWLEKGDDQPNNLVVCAEKHKNYYTLMSKMENAPDQKELFHSFKSPYSVQNNKPPKTGGFDASFYTSGCGTSSDSDEDAQCTCVGPSMPCPGVTNRARFCQCSAGRNKPVYCDECAESEGLVPGFSQHPVVYCDCVDFENPKYKSSNMTFPYGHGRDGLCEHCAAEEDEQPKPKKKRKKSNDKRPKMGPDGKGEMAEPKEPSGSRRRDNSKKSANKGKRDGKKPDKRNRKNKRDHNGKGDKDSGCCRRRLLRFVSRSSDSSD